MLTATLMEPGRFEVTERATPELRDGEVLVKVQGCGLCSSNLGPWRGVAGIAYPMEPGAPGHEAYGTVAAVASGVADLRPGDAVGALSYHAFAEHDVMPADSVVPLPPALAGRPILGEPVACAVNVYRRAGVREGDVVVVVGIGLLGALLLRLLRQAKPARVIAVSRRPASRAMAERMGADEVLSYEDRVADRVSALTGGRMADVVIEATGHQYPLDLASELTRIRGRLIIAGYHQDGPRTINLQLWNWRGLDVVNAHERASDMYMRGMREGVRMIADGTLDIESLISHSFPLADINRAFQMAAARSDNFFKAVITMEGSK